MRSAAKDGTLSIDMSIPTRRAILSLAFAAFLASCASRAGEGAGESSQASPARPRAGAYDSVQAFIDALNRLDAQAAASHIDWRIWVAEDPRLAALLKELERRVAERPPTPDELDAHPITGSAVTLREVLAQSPGVLARAARERFQSEILKDFAHETRKTEARIVAWHEDQRETATTLVMPSGDVVEMLVLGSSGDYRLVPRW